MNDNVKMWLMIAIAFLLMVPIISIPLLGLYFLPVGVILLSLANNFIFLHYYRRRGLDIKNVPYLIFSINMVYAVLQVLVMIVWCIVDNGEACGFGLIGGILGLFVVAPIVSSIILGINVFICKHIKKRQMLQATAQRFNYTEASKIPVILVIILGFIEYIIGYFTHNLPNHLTYEIIAGLPGFVIPFYAGWMIISKYGGDIKNSFHIGFIIGYVGTIVGVISQLLMYLTISGYKFPYTITGGGIYSNYFVALILISTLIVNGLIDGLLSSLGGFFSRKINKK